MDVYNDLSNTLKDGEMSINWVIGLIIGILTVIIVQVFKINIIFDINKIFSNTKSKKDELGKKEIPSTDKSKKMDFILITHRNGIKHIEKNKLIEIINQFRRNIHKSINVIDTSNCNMIYLKGLKCKYKIKDWKDKQININFINSQLNKNNNELEKEINSIKNGYISLIEIFKNSENENNESYEDLTDPNTIGSQSPVKTKQLLIEINNELNNIEKNKDYINDENFDISPLQNLMDSLEDMVENRYYNPNGKFRKSQDSYDKNNYELNKNIRNKIKQIQCHEEECGLKNERRNDAGLLMTKKKQFPELANVKNSKRNILLLYGL